MSDLPDPATGMELGVTEVAALAEAIAAGEIRLIDCREQDEWDFNRLPKAAFLPLSRFTEIAGSVLSKDDSVIVYCHHGMRSLHATQWLRAHGHEKCWSMKGGIQAWSESVDPSVPQY
ncbi:MAG: rhodanese-like domain-containing protein [Verrucomicrobiota bacterium]